MASTQATCSHRETTRAGEDFSRAALEFVHQLLVDATRSPVKLEDQLAKLASAFRAGSAGAAGLVGNAQALQVEVSADGQTLPGLSWSADKWLELCKKLRASPTTIVPTANERGLLFAACAPQEHATWLFWLEDEARRTWTPEEQSALALAAVAIVRTVIDQSTDQRWTGWLDRARKQQALESAAHLTGRLAHDFNNVLTGIMGFTELCLGQLAPNSLPHQFATEVHQAGEKGITFTTQLGNFSRRSPVRPVPTCLANVVDGALSRVKEAWGESIGLRVEVPEELCQIAIDDSALNLILRELLGNARDAIANTGTVAILARQVELTRGDCLEIFGNPAPGIYIEMSVADTGAGFSAEAKRRVFAEPLFSTKPRRRGLGLAAVYGTLYAHGGGVRLEHGDPSGTLVHVYLPVVRQKTPIQPIRRSAVPLPVGDKVLVVDDDPLTLRLMCTTLERAGYQVEPASDGVHALESFCHAKEPFGLVLSDVVMPRMTGFDLAQRLLDRDPHVNVLFTSGHIPAGFIPADFAGRNFDLLAKPFRPEGLLRAVRAALEKQTARGRSATATASSV